MRAGNTDLVLYVGDLASWSDADSAHARTPYRARHTGPVGFVALLDKAIDIVRGVRLATGPLWRAEQTRILQQAASRRGFARWLFWSVLVVPLGVLVAPAPLHAGQQAQPNHYAAPVGGITLEQAADKVRRKTGGRVLSATPVENGRGRGYNVRVLVDGKRVKQYYVDAEGRMSSR